MLNFKSSENFFLLAFIVMFECDCTDCWLYDYNIYTFLTCLAAHFFLCIQEYC